jgi:calcium-dependent protein kinase
LKPENILLESTKEFDKIKIIGFGCSTMFPTADKKILRDKRGTPYYMAPEVLKQNYD